MNFTLSFELFGLPVVGELSDHHQYVTDNGVCNLTMSGNDSRRVNSVIRCINNDLTEAIDTGFVLICAIIMSLMKLGWAFLEVGARANVHTTMSQILSCKLVDIAVSTVSFLVIGYTVMSNRPKWILHLFQSPASELRFLGDVFSWEYHFQFAVNCATIVTGVAVNRLLGWKHRLCTALISSFIYPLIAFMVWGKSDNRHNFMNSGVNANYHGPRYLGNLPTNGFVDCAGGAVVHFVGGITVFWLCVFIEELPLKSKKKYKSEDYFYASLGVFCLLFGFYGFNGGSVGGLTKSKYKSVALICTNLTLATSTATLTIFTFNHFRRTWWYKGNQGRQRQLEMTDTFDVLNGLLSGAVAITSGCHVVSYLWSCITGCLSVFVFLAAQSLMKRFNLSDPLDAFAVHAGGGIAGILLLPWPMCWDMNDEAWWWFYGHERFGHCGSQFLVQVIGIVVIGLIVSAIAVSFFFIVSQWDTFLDWIAHNTPIMSLFRKRNPNESQQYMRFSQIDAFDSNEFHSNIRMERTKNKHQQHAYGRKRSKQETIKLRVPMQLHFRNTPKRYTTGSVSLTEEYEPPYERPSDDKQSTNIAMHRTKMKIERSSFKKDLNQSEVKKLKEKNEGNEVTVDTEDHTSQVANVGTFESNLGVRLSYI